MGLRERKLLHYVARAALHDLIRRIDANGVFAHPSDRALAVHLFVILRKAGISCRPPEVKEWLMRHGWSLRQADRVRDVARQVAKGGLPKGWKPVWWSSGIMDGWEKEITLD